MDQRRNDPPDPDGQDDATLSFNSAETLELGDTAAPGATAVPMLREDERVGAYRLQRQLGSGGFAQVWEAVDERTERRVALKLMHRPLEGEERLRFEREARIAASLSHPHCVFVFGFEEWEGGPAVAMELLPGGTLQDLLAEQGPLPSRQGVDAILDVIAGLEAAFEKGILHRDVKPSNCFTTTDGRVKVGDFGLSKSVEGHDGLTVTGTFLGTPAYSSPEQVRGRPLDHRSDIFSLGATLYHLLTGEQPFGRGRAGEVLARIVSEEPPPPSVHGVDVPSGLQKALRRMMARAPDERFAGYHELRAALLPYSSRRLSPGGLARRFGAWLADDFVLGLAVMLVTGLGGPGVWLGRAHIGLTLWGPDTYTLYGVFSRLYVIAADLLLNVAYFAALEARWGASIGKRLAGLRVVGSSGSDPPARRVVARTMVWAALLWLPALALDALTAAPSGITLLVFVGGLVALFVPMRPRNGFAGLHEIISGTRVVEGHRQAAGGVVMTPLRSRRPNRDLALSYGPFMAADRPLWESAERRLLEGWDPLLERPVWILEGAAYREVYVPRAVERSLRWLQGGQTQRGPWTAFEAIEGRPFLDWVRQREGVTWEEARLVASQLAAALAQEAPEQKVDLAQVWVEPNGYVRILPLAWEDRLRAAVSPVELVQRVLVLALAGDAESGAEALPRRPLPTSVRELLERLARGEIVSLDELTSQLEELGRRSPNVSRRRRAAALVLQLPYLLLLAGVAFAIGHHAINSAPGYERLELDERLEQWRALADDTSPGALEQRSAIEELLAHGYLEATLPREQILERRNRPRGTAERRWYELGVRLANLLEGRTARQRSSVLGVPASLSAEDLEILRDVSRDRHLLADDELVALRSAAPRTLTRTSLHLARAGLTLTVLGLLAPLFGLVFRGGLSFRLVGIAVQRVDGRPASRLRCGCRAFLPYLPFAAPFVVAFPLEAHSHPLPIVLFAAAAVLVTAGFAWTILQPARGLHDHVAGTVLVPR